MPFPQKYLNEGEEIVLDQRPHWSYLAGPTLALAATVALAVLVSARVEGDLARVALVPTLLLVAVALAWVLVRYARWATTSFVITTDRLIHRKGVLSKSGREIPLERLNDVSFHQTLFQRMLGSGDLLIESAGESGQSRFDDIPQPEEFQALLYKTREARSKLLGQAQVTQVAAPDATVQLERLTKLHDEGVITDEEYAAKRQSLLDQI